MSEHPETGELLLHADGGSEGSVALHVAECAECREWLLDVESGVSEYRMEWMPAVRRTAPPPPSPWFDIGERLGQQDVIAFPEKRRNVLPRWAAIAAGAVIGVFVLRWYSETTVQAAELLQKAAQAESRAVAVPRPAIRISTRSRSVVRSAVWKQTDPVRGPDLESLRMRFASAKYSWDDPLSVRSFSAWRDGLPDANDSVKKIRAEDGSTSYEVSTSTDNGSLAEARLSLRMSDLHAYRGSLRFRDEEVIEMSEVAAAKVNPPLVADNNRPAVKQSVEPVSAAEELQVWAALRRIGADLGEPVEVKADDKKVVVEALGMSEQRRQALEESMRGLPHVEVRFRDPQVLREPSRSVPQASRTSMPPRLESQFGGNRELAEEFTNQILDSSETCLLRAHALRKLAERFGPQREAQLSAADRDLLQSLVNEHRTAFAQSSAVLIEQARRIDLVPVASGPRAPIATWQTSASRLVTVAERVDKLLTELLAVADSPVDDRVVSAELRVALAELESVR